MTDPKGTYGDLLMIETTTSEEAKGGGNSHLSDDEKAWDMIEMARHWDLWQDLMRENRVKYNVVLQKLTNVPTWKAFRDMQRDKK